MTTDRPWWFSGDEPEWKQPDSNASEPKQPEPRGPGEPMTGEPTTDEPTADERGGPGIADVLAGVGTLVSWARERVIDPHLEHADPAEHPDCVICRGMTAVSRLSDIAPLDIADIDGDDEQADDITWVPLTRQGARRGKARS